MQEKPTRSRPLAGGLSRKPIPPDRSMLLNLGFGVHAAADERHLHLTPVALLRWFGAGTVSVPWEAIKIKKRSRRGHWIAVTVGKRTIRGPAWCLGLAEPAAAADETPTERSKQL